MAKTRKTGQRDGGLPLDGIDENDAKLLAAYLCLPRADGTSVENASSAHAYMTALRVEGFVWECTDSNGERSWQVTPKGARLFNLLTRLHREIASARTPPGWNGGDAE